MDNNIELAEDIKRELDALKVDSFNYASLAKMVTRFKAGYTVEQQDREVILLAFRYVKRVKERASKLADPEKFAEMGFSRLEESVRDIRSELAKDSIRLDNLERVFPDIRKRADAFTGEHNRD